MLPKSLKNAFSRHDDQNVGLLAEFSNPGTLYQAVKTVRKKGYNRLDTFSPFPIHGMDAAMGMKTSKLGIIVMIAGLIGMTLGLYMQYWMNDVAYLLDVSGKPGFAIEQAVPVTFEVTILFAALGAVGGMLALNRLPRPYNPLFFSKRFSRATDDGFFLQISTQDGHFDRAATTDLLREIGALHVEYVDHTGAYDVAENGTLLKIDEDQLHG